MVSLTNERALEMAIEKALTGTCLENVKAGLTDISQPHHGFVSGSPQILTCFMP
jgi:type I restriction enzyme R subunit